ncbi:hypothetical protein CI238_11269, partial [Colletotrichum incanum]
LAFFLPSLHSILCPHPLLPFPLPNSPHIRRPLDPQLGPQLIHVPLQLLLPVDINHLLRLHPVLQRPGTINIAEPLPLPLLHRRVAQHRETRHRNQRVGELERLKRHLALPHDRQARQRMIEVMALAVPLHDIRTLRVIYVSHHWPRVRAHTFGIKPADIGSPDAVLGHLAQAVKVERDRSYTRPVAEDTTARRVREHGVAQAVDEVRRRSRFADGGDEVAAVGA